MLPTSLNTNEVKNSAGTEVEFSRLSNTETGLVYTAATAAPNAPHLLRIDHTFIGSGAEKRRRTRIGISKDVAGVSTVMRTVTAYSVIDAPVGDLSSTSELANVVAELISFLASLGASTTILYDCSGNGASTLINGTL